MLVFELFNFINTLFAIILLAMFGYGIYKKTSNLPFATVGVIGTFTGIMYCLLSFNVNNIDESIPNLLTGMKIAFFASTLGLSLSLMLTFINKFVFKVREGDITLDPSTREVLETLHNIIMSIQKQQNAIAELGTEIKSIATVPAGDGATPKSYDFEMLNDTVYKLKLVADAISLTPDTVECVKNITAKIDTQIKETANNLETFVAIREKATEVLPNLEQQLNRIIELQLQKADEQSQIIKEKLGGLVDGIGEIIANQSVRFENTLNKELEDNLTHFADTLAEISNKFADDYRPLASKLQEIIKMVEKA